MNTELSQARLSHNLLLGLTIKKAFIDANQDTIILQTIDNDYYSITHDPNCCEYVYYGHVNQIEFLFNSPIFKVDELEYQDIDKTQEDLEHQPRVKDTDVFYRLGISIHTERGTITLETRMEGNGQYAGDLTVCKLNDPSTYGKPKVSETSNGIRVDYSRSSDTFNHLTVDF